MTDPYEAFERDVPAHMQEDVLTMMAEAAQYEEDYHKDVVTILDRDRLDAINVRAHGIIEVEGKEYTFVIEDGNSNGTVLEAWNEDKEFLRTPRTQWALQPQHRILVQHFEREKFLLDKWDAFLTRPEVSEIPGKYSYDRRMQPGSLIERHYRDKAASFGFELVDQETAAATRAMLTERSKTGE